MKLYIANYAFQMDVFSMKEDRDFDVFGLADPSFVLVMKNDSIVEEMKLSFVREYNEREVDDNKKCAQSDFFFHDDESMDDADPQLFKRICVYEKEGFENYEELVKHHEAAAKFSSWEFYPVAVISVVEMEVGA